jgi:hypothetical protein
MKQVVSLSLGTSQRNKSAEIELLGEKFLVERIGTDGDMRKFAQLMAELDGQVDAFGVGGCDIYVAVGQRKYAFREILQLVKAAKRTPVVDGSGLKHTLERETLKRLQASGEMNFADERVFLVSAVDRYGMAQTLDELCPNVVYGDLMTALGLPIPIRSYRAVETLGRLTLPLITQLPLKWLYPTGEKQNERKPKFQKTFDWATTICGDSLYILRYAPDRLDGKTLITQSVRKANLEWFEKAGVQRVITTTPIVNGETFATNVMEGVLVALLGKPPAQITEQDYLDVLARLDWQPNVLRLQAPAASV